MPIRKDSIGMPQPLGSPFSIDRAMSLGRDEPATVDLGTVDVAKPGVGGTA